MAAAKKIITQNGIPMLPARKAAGRLACAQDYVGKLCRDGKLECAREGNAWFVSEASLHAFEKVREEARLQRARELSAQRRVEQEAYRTAVGLPAPRSSQSTSQTKKAFQRYLSGAYGRAATTALGIFLFIAATTFAGVGVTSRGDGFFGAAQQNNLTAALAQVPSPFFSTLGVSLSFEPSSAGNSLPSLFSRFMAFLFGPKNTQYAQNPPAVQTPPPTQPPSHVIAVTPVVPTYPVIERTFERIASGDYIRADAFTLILSELNRSLRAEIVRIVSNSYSHIGGGGGGGLSLDDLTDANIPNDITASNYLPLAGGTLTGAVDNSATATSTFTGGFVAERFDSSSTSTLAGVTLTNLDCSGFGNNGKLTTDAAGNVVCASDIAGSGSGTPGGGSGDVQYNDGAGGFAAESAFDYNATADRLTVPYASTTGLTATYASTSNFVVSNTFTFGAVSGFLKATAGVVATSLVNLASDVSGILPTGNGGTGWGNFQANSVLIGNGSGAIATTSAGTNGQVLALVGGVPTWTATTTFGTGLTYAGGGVTCNTANASTLGCLNAADWNLFNNKISSTSLSGISVILYNSGTGVITTTGGTFGAGNYAFPAELTVTSSTSLQNFTFANATGTQATTTSFAISSISSGSLLKTTTGGAIVAATAGTDYATPANIASAFPFTPTTSYGVNVNSTSTALALTQGVFASSTSHFVLADFSSATSTNLYATSLASTSALTVSGVSTFSNLATGQPLYLNASNQLAASSTLSVSVGGTGATSFTAGVPTIGGTSGQSLISSSTLSVSVGGTGSSTLSGLLKGNGTGGVQTAVAGVDYLTSAVTAIGPANQTADGPTVTFATSSTAFNGLTASTTITGSGDTLTFTNTLAGLLQVGGGGTGLSSVADGQLLFGSGSTALSALATTSGAGRFLTLDYSTGRPSWVATSSLNVAFSNITGTLGVSQGGTGASTFGQGWIYSDGGTGALAASTSPTVALLTATSSTATSTFAGGLTVGRGINVGNYLFGANLSSCTGSNKLTWSGGSFGCDIDMTGGGSGGGSWSTTTAAGIVLNYSNNSTDVVAIGSNSTTTAEYWFDPNTTVAYLQGRVGIGTTSPWRALSVVGSSDLGTNALAGSFTATSSTASVFPYASTTAVTVSGTASTTNLVVSGLSNSSTQPLVVNNQGVTAASSTLSVAVGGTGSSTLGGLLKGNGTGGILSAIAGTDYATPANIASAFPFTPTTFGATNANSTSTLIGFTQGIYALASSTIGSGSQTGGLTISGGATTTGNAYLGGQLAIGTAPVGSYSIVAASNIRATGYSTEGNGSAAFPLFSFVLDDDTGLFNPGNNSNALGVTAGGVEIGRFTSTSLGIASSTPWAELSVHANNGSTNKTLFAIGSSTQSATTTLFSVSNTGSTTIANGVDILTGCFSMNGTCIAATAGLTQIGPAGALQGGPGITLATSSSAFNGLTSSTTITATTNTITFTNTLAGLLADAGVANNLTIDAGTINNTPIGNLTPSTAVFTDATTSNLAVTGNASTSALTVSTTASTSALVISGLSGGTTRCLQVNASGAVSAVASGCGTGSGESQWTYFNGSGVRLATTTNQVLIGSTATATSSLAQLEVLANNSFAAFFRGGVSIGSSSPTALLTVHARASDTNKILFNIASSTANSTTTLFSILNTGNVGIGTSTPFQKLSLVGGNILQIASGNPTLASSTPTNSTTYATYVSGHFAYVADGANGLRIYDISLPHAPKFAGSYTGISAAHNVVVSGRLAYVGDTSAGLVILDVSSPSSPRLVGQYSFSNLYDIALSGKYIYATELGVIPNGDGLLRIIDVSDSSNPVLAGTYATGGNPYAVAVLGKYAYVGDYTAAAVKIVDISNPKSPALIKNYTHASLITPTDVYLSGAYMYVADEQGGFSIHNVANPASPSYVGGYTGSTQYYGVAVAGRYAYLAEFATGGLEVLDIGNPAAPSFVGSYTSGSSAYGLAVSGKYAYLASGSGGMQVVDLNGAELPAANIGSLESNTANIADALNVGGDIYAGGGLNVGISGIFSRGTIAAYVASSTQTNPVVASFMGGNVGIGTTSPYRQLAVGNSAVFGGNVLAAYFTATSSVASVFPYASSTALSVSGTGFFGTASTTNLTISSIASGSILKTTTAGVVTAAVAGTDYVTGAGLASAFPFTATTFGATNANSTSTLIGFTAGIYSLASSTIGSGSQTGGLTISGGATTTGNLIVQGTGTSSIASNLLFDNGQDIWWKGSGGAPTSVLEVSGDTTFLRGAGGTPTLKIDNSVGTNLMTFLQGGNVGIGSTSPYRLLSVGSGGVFGADVLAAYFTATSSTASIFPYASTTALTVSGTASSTNLVVSSLGSTGTTCVQVNASGLLSSTGSVCGSGGAASFPFTPTTFGATNANSTSTLIGFTAGIYSLASSTIGSGSQAGGLTISGGATTTGNAYFGGNVGVGSTSPWGRLSVDTTSLASGVHSFVVGSSTRTDFIITQAGGVAIGTSTPHANLLNSMLTIASPRSGWLGINGFSSSRNAGFYTDFYSASTTIGKAGGFVLNDDQTSSPGLSFKSYNYNFPIQFVTTPQGGGETVRMTITSSGNVGIGTTSPFATLQVATTTGKNLVLSDSGAGTDLKHWLFSSMGGNLYIGTSTDSYATSTPAALTVTNAGNVGIGTVSPLSLLQVGDFTTKATTTFASPNTLTSGSSIEFLENSTRNGFELLHNTSDNQLILTGSAGGGVFSNNIVTFNRTGNVGVGSTSPWGRLSVNANALGVGIPQFVVGSSTATNFIVTQSGNVGIGTTNPDANLQVTSASGTSPMVRIKPSDGAIGESSLLDFWGTFANFPSDMGARRVASLVGGFVTSPANTTGIWSGEYLAFNVGNNGNANDSALLPLEAVRIISGGNVGIGTTSPYAKLSVHAQNGDTSTTLFAVGSSTQSATSTFFSVTNRGNVFIGAGGSSTTTPRLFGFSPAFATGEAIVLQFGDGANTIQNGFGQRTQINSYWGLEIRGNRELTSGIATTTLAYAAGTASDPSLNVYGGVVAAPVLAVTAAVGQTGNLQEWRNSAGTALNVVTSGGNVGIGTTSPYRQLSVGKDAIFGADVLAAYFTATSSTASTFPYASTTAITVSGTASTTNLVVSGLGSSGTTCVQANASGLLSSTGSACGAGGSSFPFTPTTFGATNANSTSTLIGFTNGIYALASSTIGAGGQTTGLTISGGATTTGNAYFGSKVSIGDSVNGTNLASANGPRAVSLIDTNAVMRIWRYVATTTGSNPSIELIQGTNDNAASADDTWWDIYTRVDGGVPSGERLTIRRRTGNTNGDYLSILNGGNIGVGTTSPFAKLSIHANNGETAQTLFTVASSTQSATTTLFTILNTGNVGIGTTSPGEKLTVDLNGTSDASAITLRSGGATAFTSYSLGRTDSDSSWGVAGASSNFSDFSTQGDTILRANTEDFIVTARNASGAIRFGTGAADTEKVTIVSSGNVGVGTTSPFATLQVATTTGKNLVLSDSGAGTNLKHWLFSSMGGNLYVGTTTDSFATSTVPGLTLTNTGNVGIGTTLPSYMLDVSGTAHVTGAVTLDSTLSSRAHTLQSGGAGTASFSVNPSGVVTLNSSDTAVGAFNFTFGGGTAIASIQSNGNVGIGTTSPYRQLSVGSGGVFGADVLAAYFTATSSTASVFPYASTTAITVSGTASTTALVISSTGSSGTTCLQTSAAGVVSSTGSACGSGGSVFEWTPTTNYGANVNATSTPIWFKAGLQASSTVYLTAAEFASTTNYNLARSGTSTLINLNGQNFLTASSSSGLLTLGHSAGASLLATTTDEWGGKVGNTVIGYEALNVATSARRITAIGYWTLASSTGYDAYDNTAVGYSALRSNTIGHANTALGTWALDTNTTSSFNVALGAYALGLQTSGGANTAVGVTAGYSINTGFSNTLLGINAGYSLTSGGRNIAIGQNVNLPLAAGNSQLNIGNLLYGTSIYTGDTVSSAPQLGGAFGISSTSPWAKLSVHANNGETNTNLFAIGSSTQSATTTLFSITNTGVASTTFLQGAGLSTCVSNNVLTWTGGLFGCEADDTGAGGYAFPFTATTFGAINANATSTLMGFTAGIYSLASSTIGNGTATGGLTISGGATTTGTAYFASSVGIGTSSPFRKLSVTNTVSAAQVAIAFDATRYTELQTDSIGDFYIDPQGGDAVISDDNFWVCTGGCPASPPTGTGNLIVENKIGVGTSTPNWALQAAGARPFIALSDTGAGTNLKHWTFSSQGGNLYIATSSDSLATSTIAAVTVNNNGFVGIGSTTPSQGLSVAQKLFVANGNPSSAGTATSTFIGDVLITGKLDVTTIDPVYTIDGTKYATYGLSSIGVKEEISTTITLADKNTGTGKYEYDIKFSDLKEGSDLWLFYQVTDFGEAWQHLVINLTPGFDGSVFYAKDPATGTLRISATQAGEVSLRMVANRFDAAQWPNLRPDQNEGFTGFEIQSKR